MELNSITRYVALPLMLGAMAVGTLSCDRHKPTNTSTSGIATVYCDNTFETIMNQEIDVFEYIYPNASIMPYYVDAQTAVDSLLDLKTNLIVSAVDLTDKQKEYLKQKNRPARTMLLAVDAVALIVNNDNGIDELSVQDLRDIFSGKVRRWGEVAPTNLKNDSILIVFDHKGSSIISYMKDKVLNGGEFGPNIYAQNSSNDVFDQVEKRKNAIGLIGVSWVTSDLKAKDSMMADKESRNDSLMKAKVEQLKDSTVANLDFTDKVKVLPIRSDTMPLAYKPYQLYIDDGRYPLFRKVYVITTSAGGSLGRGFYSFLTGFLGQKVLMNTGILPGAIQPRYVCIE